MDLHGKTRSAIWSMMSDTRTELTQRIQDAALRQKELLGEHTAALLAGDRTQLSLIEAKLKKTQALLLGLSDELRFSDLDKTPEARARTRMSGKSVREAALDAIDELGVPSAPSTISDFCAATTNTPIPATRFASLRRDEERAARRDPASRPAWITPALSTAHLTPLPRLFTSSAWALERRLVGARSARVNHLYTTLAFIERFERMRAAADGAAAAMENLVIRFARGIPGATSTDAELDGPRIRQVIQRELEVIEPADLEERRAAAARLSKHRDNERLWGLPTLIEGGANADRAIDRASDRPGGGG